MTTTGRSSTIVSSVDFDWGSFVEGYFINGPAPPGTTWMEILSDNLDENGLVDMLKYMLFRGIEILYGKVKLHELTPTQINRIQEYFNGIGIEVKYNVRQLGDNPADRHIHVSFAIMPPTDGLTMKC